LLLVGAGVAAALVAARGPGRPDAAAAAKADAEEQKRLEAERRKLDEERDRLERERRRAEFARLLHEGDAAHAKGQHADAERAYAAALKLFPHDEAALKGLVAARTAQAVAARGDEEKGRRQAEYARLMDRGKEALAARQFFAAVQAFAGAAQLVPGDPAAARGLAEAQEAAAADQGERKRQADYQDHMDAGRAAMEAQRYPDALREYLAALRLVPDDPAALRGQKAAEARLEDAREQEERRAGFARLMEKAKGALRNKRYDEAVEALEAALRLSPGDPEVKQMLQEATRARRAARGRYDDVMQQADAALSAGRYEEAGRLYGEALALVPDDPAATKGKQNAERALGDAQAGVGAYLRYIDQASLAMQSGRYGDALRLYGEALRVAPGDQVAIQGLRDARTAAGAILQRGGDFDRAMQSGTAALRMRQWSDAVAAFQAALRAVPDSPQAAAGLRKARFGQAMSDGQAALNASRFADAVRSFEEALRQIPGDPAASGALRQARALNR
jgi:tetratricopeptide (TPR) repeat protein